MPRRKVNNQLAMNCGRAAGLTECRDIRGTLFDPDQTVIIVAALTFSAALLLYATDYDAFAPTAQQGRQLR